MKGVNYLWGILGLLILGALIYFVIRLNHNPSDESKDDDALEDVDCGGGKKASRYKHPSKMFPIIIRDYTTNVKLTTDILNKLVKDSSGSSSIGVEANNKAQRLREELNQDNAFYENQLKAIFFEVNRRPCNDSLSNVYTNYVKEMSFKVIQMKQFVTDISKPATEVKSQNRVKEKVAVVINPSKAEVKKPSDTIRPDERVILKEESKIGQAISELNNKIVTEPPVEKYKLLVEDERYTGENYLSEIRDGNGKTILTVHVTNVTNSLDEATMYLSIDDERTPSFNIRANESILKYLDDKNYKVTINITRFAKGRKVGIAHYRIIIEKRI